MVKLASITLEQALLLLLARGFFWNYSAKTLFLVDKWNDLVQEFYPVEGLATSGGNG
jgi:hypothetical protein